MDKEDLNLWLRMGFNFIEFLLLAAHRMLSIMTPLFVILIAMKVVDVEMTASLGLGIMFFFLATIYKIIDVIFNFRVYKQAR